MGVFRKLDGCGLGIGIVGLCIIVFQATHGDECDLQIPCGIFVARKQRQSALEGCDGIIPFLFCFDLGCDLFVVGGDLRCRRAFKRLAPTGIGQTNIVCDTGMHFRLGRVSGSGKVVNGGLKIVYCQMRQTQIEVEGCFPGQGFTGFLVGSDGLMAFTSAERFIPIIHIAVGGHIPRKRIAFRLLCVCIVLWKERTEHTENSDRNGPAFSSPSSVSDQHFQDEQDNGGEKKKLKTIIQEFHLALFILFFLDLIDLGVERLHDGFIEGTANAVDVAPEMVGGWGKTLESAIQTVSGKELVFLPDHSLFDGRYANNGWLQELPDPVTKVAWDNAALISPMYARELGVENGDLLTLTVSGKELKMPAFLLPGQNRDTIAVALGYGRLLSDRAAGRLSRKPSIYQIADGVGFDTYSLRNAAAVTDGFASVSVNKGIGKYELATTQDHNPIRPDEFMGDLEFNEEQRKIGEFARVVDTDFEPKMEEVAEAVTAAGPHHPDLVSPWKEHEYTGHRWAMSIDLNLCTGCSACVVACQSENNIAVVGKDELAYGREMHWLRIDRYFSGEDVEDPGVVHQPVTCNQCENAPCEQVCPVAATAHNEEGLNDMVYNRCIGTRYCSNNCPYKVRRFNYFNNTKDPSPTEQMGYNPEVTLRSRGVMEKCTYCVQRINRSKIQAHNKGRDVQDGEVTSACAQSCPTSAITFGDLADSDSQVSRTQKSHRAYKMLAELNVKPRTSFLAKLRNPATREEG